MKKEHYSTLLFASIVCASTFLFQFHPLWMNPFFEILAVSPKVLLLFVISSSSIGIIFFGMRFSIPKNTEKILPVAETELDDEHQTEETIKFLSLHFLLFIKVFFSSLILTGITYAVLVNCDLWCSTNTTSTLFTLCILFINGFSTIILGYRLFLFLEYGNIQRAQGIESLAGQFISDPERIKSKEYGYGNFSGK